MQQNLLQILTQLGSPRVLLVGDFMLDIYTYGDAVRISPEAPVPVLKVAHTEHRCGGAGAVAADLASLGAAPLCLGIIGSDQNGEILTKLLTDAGAEVTALIHTADRPTTTKQRLIGLAQHRHPQQLMRIDRECSDPVPDELSRRLLDDFTRLIERADVVCLQDYNKGLLNHLICTKMIELARAAGKMVLVDPSMTDDYSKYRGATVITPNRKEASCAAGFEICNADDAARAAGRLLHKLALEAVVITLDKQGAYLRTPRIGRLIPTRPRSVYDVTGAGDMVLAALTVALAAGADYEPAVQLSNIAGGLEVQKFGTATVSVEEIISEIMALEDRKSGKLHTLEELRNELAWHRRNNKTIVFTNGCFDVIHRGHIEYLKFTRSQGDIVVVGLNSDSSVRAIKGPGRPINNQRDRVAVLSALESVDYIVIFDAPTPIDLIRAVKPDILVKGEDWAEKGVVGREFVESYGGKVVLAPLVPGKSSTATIQKIKSSQAEL